ncbi:hypothetical protein DFP72DRAFT_1071114 [Ephemerocybe angulata]|uniref:Uncharacterized protein n=1 Tax=Ephemerocybe angulata TaxID=980116 RepID=A0A8H6HS97_9AGAR|nr:hypothetical protein DFP72DRAFT_1071114 [Tulosesus angulatus]
MPSSDKVYVAYYTKPNPKHSQDYHFSILICPKNPVIGVFDESGAAPKIVNSTIYHAVNLNNSPWRYESKDVPARTPRLLGVLCLGKLSGGSTSIPVDRGRVDRLLKGVPITVDCRVWVINAIERLVTSGYVYTQTPQAFHGPGGYARVVQRGSEFVFEMTKRGETMRTTSVFACDAFGAQIGSDIGPFLTRN